jgi:hypothetical protein
VRRDPGSHFSIEQSRLDFPISVAALLRRPRSPATLWPATDDTLTKWPDAPSCKTALRRCRTVRPGCGRQLCALYGVAIKPLAVATIQRLPQRTIESIRPMPGTVSPRVAIRIPSGPPRTAVPPRTSRTVQPSIVVGLVSGAGVIGPLGVREPVGVISAWAAGEPMLEESTDR